MATEQQLEQYRTEGYFIAADAVAPEMVEELREALGRCERKVRAGAVVDDSEGIRLDGDPVEALSHIRALLAPEFGEPVFAEYLESAPVLRFVNALLGEELRLGWVSALVVDDRPYRTGWHRDIGREERDGSYEVEMEILGRYRKNLVKWHLALIDDPCLWLVPGSHRRYRTGEEREFLVGGAAGELSTGEADPAGTGADDFLDRQHHPPRPDAGGSEAADDAHRRAGTVRRRRPSRRARRALPVDDRRRWRKPAGGGAEVLRQLARRGAGVSPVPRAAARLGSFPG